MNSHSNLNNISMPLQQCKFERDRFVPNIEEFDLRVVHYGGDYGNFITYAVEWMVGATDVEIQQALIDTGAAHGYNTYYLHREFQQPNVLYEFQSVKTEKFPTVRLHWLFPAYQDPVLEAQLISATGPTVFIDYTDCMLELVNNRRHKMPVPYTLDPEIVISMHRHYSMVCEQIKTWPNVFVFSMKKLSTDPAGEFRRLLEFLNVDSIRSDNEVDNMLQYWKSCQPFLGRDQQVREWLQLGATVQDARINDIERELILAFPKYDYNF